MQRLIFVFFAVALAAMAGCVAETEPVGAELEWIAYGEPEDGEPATVVVYNRRGGLCTGSLIAPRVVLTAKHCVQAAGASAPDDPSWFTIGVGNSIRSLSQTLTASRVRTTPGTWTDGGGRLSGLVGVDVALINLATGVTFETYGIQREHPRNQVGQNALNIGFGQTPSGETGRKYKATTDVRWIDGNVIYTGPNTCQGDSGGPILDPDTREVFGVTSFGSGSACGTGIAGFNRIDPYLDMIDEAIRDSGECVNDGAERCDGFDNDCNGEVDEGCMQIGEPCEFSEECIGNNCADTGAGRICTVECDPLRPALSCPTGLYCERTDGCSGLCVPGEGGELGNDADCTTHTDCASLFCADPGDGRRRCLTPCRGDAGMCLAGEVCAAGGGSCNGCVDESIVVGSRGLGESCDDDTDCGSALCVEDGGVSYCTRPCATEDECADGFHCREAPSLREPGADMGPKVCIRGERGLTGDGCVTNGDCAEGSICAERAGVRWCTPIFDEGEEGCRGECPEDFTCVAAGGARVCSPDAGVVGETCTMNAECLTDLCVTAGSEEGICTRRCGSDAPCAPGFECVRTSDGREAVCLEPVPEPRGDDGGCCSTTRPRGAPPGGLALVGLGIVALLLRRRRR